MAHENVGGSAHNHRQKSQYKLRFESFLNLRVEYLRFQGLPNLTLIKVDVADPWRALRLGRYQRMLHQIRQSGCLKIRLGRYTSCPAHLDHPLRTGLYPNAQ